MPKSQDEDITERIFQAAKRQLLDDGVPGLNYDQLAVEAQTSRAAIYRRWPQRGALIVATLKRFFEIGETPDTGNVVDDLLAHAATNLSNQALIGTGTDPSALWATILSPDIITQVMETAGLERRIAGRLVVDRAVERGQLPQDVNGDLLLDAVAGFGLFRTVVARNPPTCDEERAVIASLCANPPRR